MWSGGKQKAYDYIFMYLFTYLANSYTSPTRIMFSYIDGNRDFFLI